MKEFKLVFMSNDRFCNKDIFEGTIEVLKETILKDKSISFVNAMLPGADALAYMFANQNNVKCYEFNINRRLTGDPVMRVYAEMADFADGAILFCEPEDDMDFIINIMKRQKKTVGVVTYLA